MNRPTKRQTPTSFPSNRRALLALSWVWLALFALASCGGGSGTATGPTLDVQGDVPFADTTGGEDLPGYDFGGGKDAVDVAEDVADLDGGTLDSVDADFEIGPDVEDAGDIAEDAPEIVEDVLIPDVPLACRLDQCDIAGECFDNGDANPENPCESCQVVMTRDEWSADDSATCDDGVDCTDGDHCDGGECVGWSTCADGNDCTADACDLDSGECVFESLEGPCDDGNPCTVGDACNAGECLPGSGTLTCPEAPLCGTFSCVDFEGCVLTLLDGTQCDDGNPCTLDDSCQDGACLATSSIDCDDNDVCTIDTCNDSGACVHLSVADACADDNPCTDEACDSQLGCIYPANNDPCDDGNPCTENDMCAEGMCHGTVISLDDGNVCTDNFCDPVTGVFSLPNDNPCQDGDACTLGDVCADGTCQPGSGIPDCEDNNLCTDDSCDPETGCVNAFNANPCDDQSLCTQGDTCTQGECVGTPLPCNDFNDCTTDSCNPLSGCVHSLIVSNACRPNIIVDYPPRAATILDAATSVVTVTGTVTSGAGAIALFTLNGVDVPVDPDTGAFSYEFEAQAGGNTLHFEAEDEFGTPRTRIQGFHWSKEYFNPDGSVAGSGMVTPGMGIWLSQQTVDDGDRTLPADDLATIFEMVFASFDIGALIPNPAVTNQSIWSFGRYDLYIQNLQYDPAQVSLVVIDGGIRVEATISNIHGDLNVKKVGCGGGFLEPCWGSSNYTGDLSMSAIELTSNLIISVNPDHTLKVDVQATKVNIVGLDVNLDGAVGFFANWIIDIFAPSFASDIESQFAAQLEGTLGPMLGDALQALAFNLSFAIPRLDGAIDPGTGQPIVVDLFLESDFEATTFTQSNGGKLEMRARSYPGERGVPAGEPFDSNLGTPGRVACGQGTQTLVVPGVAPMEVVLADDTLNEILHAAWWGGLMEFPVPASMLGSVDLGQYGITNLDLFVSAWLPPVASDCGPTGNLVMHVADLKITASLKLFGQPMDVVIYGAFEAGVEVGASDGAISITILSIDNFEMEVNILQENLIASEGVIRDLIMAQLVPSLEGMLGGGEPLASFPLPEIDLSESVGLPPGTAVIRIGVLSQTGWEGRIDGNTIIYGALQ